MSFAPLEGAAHILLDPAAGDGAAIRALRGHWFTAAAQARIVGIELEAERARTLAVESEPPDTSLHADAFHVAVTPDPGASLLYLNPPYDFDRAHQRLEQRFLARWTSALVPGIGVLMLVVPFYALRASAAWLSTQFVDLQAWIFPKPFFDAFRQCVLVGRRRLVPLPFYPLQEAMILQWSSDAPSLLPELPEPGGTPPCHVGLCSPGLHLQPQPLDLHGLLDGFRPWTSATFTAEPHSVRDLIGPRFPVAQPPRPAHLTLALTAGVLNGKILLPNEPHLPPLLVKGSYTRTFVPKRDCFDDEGNKTGTIEVERPKLTVNVLRLDTFQFHQLRAGSTPSGTDDISQMNTSDLLSCYGASLASLMRLQFPALHDPSDPQHHFPLPPMERAPYRVQADAIRTALKLLALGHNPQALAEVGTGKSTVSLSIAAALSPKNFPATTRELPRLGFPTSRLRPIRRILVVCPPHLLKSWEDQVAAVLPGSRVIVIRNLSDLEIPATVYLLSKETAKLSHSLRGLGATSANGVRVACPRCGAPVPLPPAKLASERARCSSNPLRPGDAFARLAEDLAAVLVVSYPKAPRLRQLLSSRRILLALADRHASPDAEESSLCGPLPARDRLLPLAQRLLALLSCLSKSERLPTAISALDALVRAGGLEAEFAGCLDAVPLRQTLPNASATPGLLVALDLLTSLGTWTEGPPCGEPLFQAVPQPRRYPLARYILRRHPRLVDYLIVDEWHQYANRGSAQQKAAHRLVQLPGVPTFALTGTFSGGYADSVFANTWALSDEFRRQFQLTDLLPFTTRYGYRTRFVPFEEEDAGGRVLAFGSHTDRETRQEGIRQLGLAPGIHPRFVLDFLLPTSVFMQKTDLDRELPPYSERPVAVPFAPADPFADQLLDQYLMLLSRVTSRIQEDRGTDLAGSLWGAMSELPSYLDRCTDDLPPFVVSYPKHAGGALVAEPKMFPASWLTPKERYVLERVGASIRRGRPILLFLRNTGPGTYLSQRYLRLLLRHLGERAVFLDVDRVSAAKREDWLNANVIRTKIRILLTNAKAVETGLNNLVYFTDACWVQGPDFDARVFRQANGRVHRIGQTRPVTIDVPYYPGTAQEMAVRLVARKVSASLVIDGIDIEGELESAGATDDYDDAASAALNFGEALYREWQRTP